MRACCIFALAALVPALADHAGAQTATSLCQPPQRLREIAELMFGRDIGGRVAVTESAWKRFLAREIAPRFPDGLTVISARGQWLNRPAGALVSEPSKLVLIVLPGNADDQSHLDAVVAAYKRRFHQQSVGVVEQSACVSF